MSQIGEIARQLDFTWVGVPPDSPFDGRTLGELRFAPPRARRSSGSSATARCRPIPDGEVTLERGDLVAVLGTRDQIARFDQARKPVAAAV